MADPVIIGNCHLYLGDCREILPTLIAEGIGAVVSDVPYGIKWDGKVTRGKNGTGKVGPTRHFGETIQGDDVPFDPTPLLDFPEVILWGFNHFPEKLGRGTVLVWLKRYDNGFGSFLSDAELAWFNKGHGVYCFRDLSMQGDSLSKAHPTQKPVPLMEWCIGFTKAQTILDPYCGSGTTLVACAKLGRRGIGIEIDERHFQTACRRISDVVSRPDMFIETAKPQPPPASLFDEEAA